MLEFILERYNYWAIIVLMMMGLYVTFQANNLIKRIVGLSIFQTAVFLFYITLSKIAGGTAPILYKGDYPKKYSDDGHGSGAYATATEGAEEASGYGHGAAESLTEIYSNPLPHVLILTAIVVGVATLAVGLALIVRIREAYGTIEADDIRAADIAMAQSETAAEGA